MEPVIRKNQEASDELRIAASRWADSCCAGGKRCAEESVREDDVPIRNRNYRAGPLHQEFPDEQQRRPVRVAVARSFGRRRGERFEILQRRHGERSKFPRLQQREVTKKTRVAAAVAEDQAGCEVACRVRGAGRAVRDVVTSAGRAAPSRGGTRRTLP